MVSIAMGKSLAFIFRSSKIGIDKLAIILAPNGRRFDLFKPIKPVTYFMQQRSIQLGGAH
ncbi:hypothetical protein DM806_16900 [Sphingobium lactosutens]|nr:hypothetical protein [Sphingobium lactosutens]